MLLVKDEWFAIEAYKRGWVRRDTRLCGPFGNTPVLYPTSPVHDKNCKHDLTADGDKEKSRRKLRPLVLHNGSDVLDKANDDCFGVVARARGWKLPPLSIPRWHVQSPSPWQMVLSKDKGASTEEDGPK